MSPHAWLNVLYAASGGALLLWLIRSIENWFLRRRKREADSWKQHLEDY